MTTTPLKSVMTALVQTVTSGFQQEAPIRLSISDKVNLRH